jgi:transcriptional repressor NrdR
VIKRDGEREPFDRSKLLRGILTASGKTGLTPAHIEALVDDLEAEFQQRAVREITSTEIGEAVLRNLQGLSEVAYVRFASVYRQFQGVRDFVDELDRLDQTGNRLSSSSPLSHRLDQPNPAMMVQR